MSLETALRAYVLADAAVTALAGQPMYPRRLPQGPTLPALVYQRIDTRREHDMDGPDGLPRPRVQVTRPYAPQPPRSLGHAVLEQPAIKLGSSVNHPKFGDGVVTGYEGSGAHARVQVHFAEEGSKWLVLAYANLTPA